MNDAVKVHKRGAVLEVTLDRPKANAIDVRTRHSSNSAMIRVCVSRYSPVAVKNFSARAGISRRRRRANPTTPTTAPGDSAVSPNCTI
jgi:enoyl-CoA hydratase/carnithine racemase